MPLRRPRMKKLLPWIPHLLIPSVVIVSLEEAVLVLEEAHLLLLRQDQEEALALHYRWRLFTKRKAQDPGYPGHKEKDDAAVHQEEHIKQHSEFSQDRYQDPYRVRNHQRFPFLTIERCKASEALIRAANLLVRWVLQNYT
ncbi:hypothetical protein [Chlamydia suis]|uniref:hypothetical protein n=1 Tax=Chlamydia suis TaxID=83559 RepID=UPI0015D6BAAA|nr:hypothetical protein [Chlamydia suis]